jgi:O-antigen biosynthesis protein
MRVALLTHHAPAGDAIGEQMAEKLAFLLERGADVRIFLESDQRLVPSLRGYTSVVADGVPDEEAWEFLTTADLIVAEYGHFYPLLHLLPRLCGGRARILFDYHGVTPRELWPAEGRGIVEAAARWRDLVWCAEAALVHSRFARDELVKATGFPAERISCLGYVVDAAWFRPGRPEKNLRASLKLGLAPILLYVGRLAPNKRVPVLIEALTLLGDLTPAPHLVLVGDGTDVYEAELNRCREGAAALGVEHRVHSLGQVSPERLLDAYRSADVLVLPSRHEAFGMPIVEAMACGLPVIAARAAALPETAAGAGLTFTPDDAADLARQIRRVLASVAGAVSLTPRPGLPQAPAPATRTRRLRVAVVSFRYGTDFVGGAETSLRIIAESFTQAGQHVEVFTTCTRSVAAWSNDVAEGTTMLNGVPVHHYRVDPGNYSRHVETVQAVREADGDVPAEVGRAYFTHSIQSSRLVQALGRRIGAFDAVVVGPYLLGLTHAIASAFPDKTVLLPCFHDEAFARLTITREVYERVAGILYHSPEEQAFAEQKAGINHPYSVCIGTWIDSGKVAEPARAARRLAGVGKYLVYCGRYSPHKGLPRLIAFARRYHERWPERFTFVFLGEGEVPIPDEPWARDLGFVDEQDKQDVLAGASALIQLSCQESLSLVTLEAWAQATPVIAAAECDVLAGLISRSGGGQLVKDFESFAAALDNLWKNPERWQILGRQGRDYVRAANGCRELFTTRVVEAITQLARPLREQMRTRGLERAAAFNRETWRARFSMLVDDLLHAEPRPYRQQVRVEPRMSVRQISLGTRSVLIPVQVSNAGNHVIVPEGPGRTVLHGCVDEGEPMSSDAPRSPDRRMSFETCLPDLVPPGQSVAAAVAVPVPQKAGTFSVRFWAQGFTNESPQDRPEPTLQLAVHRAHVGPSSTCCAPLLDQAEAALVEAQRLQRLPDNYTDVTLGWLARWKRWIKRKILGNFKHAYVDVLSHQQSAVNGQLVTALRELTECCATLDHAVRQLQERVRDDALEPKAGLDYSQFGAGAPAGARKAGAGCSPAEKSGAAPAP